MDETAQATPVLTNECELNRENLEASLRAYMKTPLNLVADILYVLIIVAQILSIAIPRAMGIPIPIRPMTIFVIVAAAFMLCWRHLFLPKYSAKVQMKRREELLGADRFPMEFELRDDALVSRVLQFNEERRLSYDKLRCIHETEKLIVLVTKQRQLSTLDKAGFRNGTEEDFWRLIAEKCPEAKIKRR